MNDFYEGYWHGLEAHHDFHPANRIRYDEIHGILGKLSLKIPKGRILDVGCGSGALISKLMISYPNFEFYGSDISQNAINIAREKLPQLTFYLEDFSSKKKSVGNSPGKFDIVISSEVIEHVKDDKEFLKNIANSINDGGYLILTTQSGPLYRMDREVLGHIRHYSKQSMLDAASATNLELIGFKQFGFPFLTLQKIFVEAFFGRVTKTLSVTKGDRHLAKFIFNSLYRLMKIKIVRRGPQLTFLFSKNA